MSAPQFEGRLFINNEFVEGKTGETFTVNNPYDGKPIPTQVHVAAAADVDAAVAAASAALPGWKATKPVDRQKCMLKLADLIEENVEALALPETVAMGQPAFIAKWVNLMCPPWWRYYAGWTDKVESRMSTPEYGTGDETLRLIFYEPRGVCAGIIAWNGSHHSVAQKVAPAVAAGCTFILKSSEKSPLGCLKFAELVKQAGFPPGVINIISGPGSTGQMLAEHMGISKISFTGSTVAGKKVQVAAAKSNLKACTLELGGKSAALVFADAKLDHAIQDLARFFLINSGQICAMTSRVLVHERIAPAFIEGVKQSFAKAIGSYGNPSELSTMVGPVADSAQFNRILDLIKQGKDAGGNILTGGGQHGKDGLFIEPTLVQADNDNPLWKHEVFGPVIVVRTFKTEEEAVKLANDTEYGLSGAIYTSNTGTALRVARQMDTGMIGVNVHGGATPQVPFGGWKMSGQGRESGIDGLMSYLQTKTVHLNMAV